MPLTKVSDNRDFGIFRGKITRKEYPAGLNHCYRKH
jgi:hypothetical protein